MQTVELFGRQRPGTIGVQGAGGQCGAAGQTGHFNGRQGLGAIGIDQRRLDVYVVNRFGAVIDIGAVIVLRSELMHDAVQILDIIVISGLRDHGDVYRHQRRIGNRFDINGGGRRRGQAVAIGHGVVKTGAAAVIGIGREHDIAIDNLDRAANRVFDRRDLQGIAIGIGIVGK